MLILEFDRGTLLVRSGNGMPPDLELPGGVFDPRVRHWRTPARFYRDVVRALQNGGIAYRDDASTFEPLRVASQLERRPFPHQEEAVEAWRRGGGRGVVVLPTGAGKTHVAQMIIERVAKSALVITPTIDLMQQWYAVLAASFDTDVGLVGGGHHDVRPLTVTTYDSAYVHMERLGNRFAVLVFDECHHLPGPSYQIAAESSLAPYRLGLTATPEREDGRQHLFEPLVGPTVYRKEIRALAGGFLSDYETYRIAVRLSTEEERRYREERAIYLDFVRRERINLAAPGGWSWFLRLSSRSETGRRALLAYREQRTIAQGSSAKLRFLSRILESHRRDLVLIFTSDNETVYRISRRFLIPAITHQTKVRERREILERFNAGKYPFLVTSKVLNEGVDVPAANVAVVLSGSGSVREHVQRLGRILRRREGKQAVLYEVVAGNTAEESVSARRRRHHAYR